MWQRLLKLRPALLQLAEKFLQTRTLLHFLSHRSHGDHCLCRHGKPLNLSGHGLDLLLQSASALCWVGMSSAVLQPLMGGERTAFTWTVDSVTVFTWTVSHGFLSLSPLPAAFSAASVYSTLCNLGDSSGFSVSLVRLDKNIPSVFAPLSPPAGLSVLSSSLSMEFSCCSSFRASDRRWTAELSAFCCLWEHRLSARLLQTRYRLRHRKQSWTSCCEEKLKHITSTCAIWILATNQTQTSFDWRVC